MCPLCLFCGSFGSTRFVSTLTNLVRISQSKIDKLACQAQSGDILTLASKLYISEITAAGISLFIYRNFFPQYSQEKPYNNQRAL